MDEGGEECVGLNLMLSSNVRDMLMSMLSCTLFHFLTFLVLSVLRPS